MADAFALFRQELRLAYVQGTTVAVGLIFFLCLVVIFTFGVGPALKTLAKVGPAILWAGPLLSILLGLDHLFQADEEDGTLDVYRLAPTPMAVIVLAKAAAYWVSTALPLVVAAPVFGLMLAMSPASLVGCFLCLVIGTPALVLIGAMASALTVQVKRNGMLLTILAAPFLVPALIFGVSASTGFAAAGQPFATPFLFLSAFTLFSAVLCPIAAAAALKAGKPITNSDTPSPSGQTQ